MRAKKGDRQSLLAKYEMSDAVKEPLELYTPPVDASSANAFGPVGELEKDLITPSG